jgi:hypothetical protein
MRAAEQIQLSSLRNLLYLVGYRRRKLIATESARRRWLANQAIKLIDRWEAPRATSFRTDECNGEENTLFCR